MHLWGVVRGFTSGDSDDRGLVGDGVDRCVPDRLIGRVVEGDGGSVVSRGIGVGVRVRVVDRADGLPDQLPVGQGRPHAGHRRVDLPGHRLHEHL